MATRVDVDVRLDYSGLGQMLRSDQVTADVEAAAERVRAAAVERSVLVRWGSKSQPRQPITVAVRVDHDNDRTRAHVGLMDPAGLRAEAKYHLLTSAVDAAR